MRPFFQQGKFRDWHAVGHPLKIITLHWKNKGKRMLLLVRWMTQTYLIFNSSSFDQRRQAWTLMKYIRNQIGKWSLPDNQQTLHSGLEVAGLNMHDFHNESKSKFSLLGNNQNLAVWSSSHQAWSNMMIISNLKGNWSLPDSQSKLVYSFWRCQAWKPMIYS